MKFIDRPTGCITQEKSYPIWHLPPFPADDHEAQFQRASSDEANPPLLHTRWLLVWQRSSSWNLEYLSPRPQLFVFERGSDRHEQSEPHGDYLVFGADRHRHYSIGSRHGYWTGGVQSQFDSPNSDRQPGNQSSCQLQGMRLEERCDVELPRQTLVHWHHVESLIIKMLFSFGVRICNN